MPQDSSNSVSFADLGLITPILNALSTIGYEEPSPIQAQTIPIVMSGADVVGQAQTGTGKTAAFALPLISNVDISLKHPQVLVLAPTRELAIQVAEAFEIYTSELKGFEVLPIYGGQSYDTQLRQLRRGVHVVVGTPGRVMDHIRRGTLKLSHLSTLVLDEADEMLRMGFIDDVEWILEHTPESRQIALFSATMPPAIRKIAKRHLKHPKEVKIKVKSATAETVTQRHAVVHNHQKLDALSRILEIETYDGVIIFVRTKTATIELAETLQARGYAAAPLNGDVQQRQRERTVNQLKQAKLDILVATDVVARGLDVERISLVINYDAPQDVEAYVHRIGRTGRAGRDGDAILFVAPRERRLLKTIERVTRTIINPMKLPSVQDVNRQRIQKFKDRIQSILNEEQDLKPFYDIIEAFEAESGASSRDIAASLAYLLQDTRSLFMEETDIDCPAPRKERRKNEQNGGSQRRSTKRPRLTISTPQAMENFRVEVGHRHGVKPGNLVGAIANEAGLNSEFIGQIEIFDNFSTVSLPSGIPQETFQVLKSVWVCHQKLNISRLEGKDAQSFKSHSNALPKNKGLARKRVDNGYRNNNGSRRRAQQKAS